MRAICELKLDSWYLTYQSSRVPKNLPKNHKGVDLSVDGLHYLGERPSRVTEPSSSGVSDSGSGSSATGGNGEDDPGASSTGSTSEQTGGQFLRGCYVWIWIGGLLVKLF